MALKRKISASEEELCDLLTYSCPFTGLPHCPPFAYESLNRIQFVFLCLGARVSTTTTYICKRWMATNWFPLTLVWFFFRQSKTKKEVPKTWSWCFRGCCKSTSCLLLKITYSLFLKTVTATECKCYGVRFVTTKNHIISTFWFCNINPGCCG